MNIKAIVYTSNTGYTAEYAKLLGEKTGLSVYSLDDAAKELNIGSEIIYLGWVMAFRIQGYERAKKLFKISVLCGVCLGTSGSLTREIRKAQKIEESLPLFTLQGGFDMNKLRGMNKFIMKVMKKVLTAEITKKSELTEEDRTILRLLEDGGSCVCEENLASVIEELNR